MRDDLLGRKLKTFLMAPALVATALVAAACGHSSPATTGSTAPQSAEVQRATIFAQCLRTHGEPNWPSPDGQGGFNISKIDLKSPSYLRSFSDCYFLHPARMKLQESSAQRRQVHQDFQKFATCINAHGYPYPGPAEAQAKHPKLRVKPTSRSFRTVMKKCGAVRYPGGWWIQ